MCVFGVEKCVGVCECTLLRSLGGPLLEGKVCGFSSGLVFFFFLRLGG